MRRSREAAARTRRTALEAASRLFRERGIEAVSVGDVMASIGMTAGGFYRHFESKEALAAEAVRRYVENGRARLSILRDAKLRPLRRLRMYFESLNDAVAKAELSAGCLLGNFGAELSDQAPLVRKRVGEAFEAWSDAIAVVIGEAQQTGAISGKASPKALAEFTLHAWEGAVLRAKVSRNRAPLDQFVAIAFSRVLA